MKKLPLALGFLLLSWCAAQNGSSDEAMRRVSTALGAASRWRRFKTESTTTKTLEVPGVETVKWLQVEKVQYRKADEEHYELYGWLSSMKSVAGVVVPRSEESLEIEIAQGLDFWVKINEADSKTCAAMEQSGMICYSWFEPADAMFYGRVPDGLEALDDIGVDIGDDHLEDHMVDVKELPNKDVNGLAAEQVKVEFTCGVPASQVQGRHTVISHKVEQLVHSTGRNFASNADCSLVQIFTYYGDRLLEIEETFTFDDGTQKLKKTSTRTYYDVNRRGKFPFEPTPFHKGMVKWIIAYPLFSGVAVLLILAMVAAIGFIALRTMKKKPVQQADEAKEPLLNPPGAESAAVGEHD